MNRDIRHILCPVDFSELAHRALDHAAAMALWYKAPLTVLHVFANVPLDLAPAVPHPPDRGQREAELQRFAEWPQTLTSIGRGLPPKPAASSACVPDSLPGADQ